MTLVTDFLFGFLLNLFVAIIVVRFIYYPQTRDKHYVFTFLAFNTIIYFVLSLMANSDLVLASVLACSQSFPYFDTAPIQSQSVK